jgi:hypothetical protein
VNSYTLLKNKNLVASAKATQRESPTRNGDSFFLPTKPSYENIHNIRGYVKKNRFITYLALTELKKVLLIMSNGESGDTEVKVSNIALNKEEFDDIRDFSFPLTKEDLKLDKLSWPYAYRNIQNFKLLEYYPSIDKSDDFFVKIMFVTKLKLKKDYDCFVFCEYDGSKNKLHIRVGKDIKHVKEYSNKYKWSDKCSMKTSNRSKVASKDKSIIYVGLKMSLTTEQNLSRDIKKYMPQA